MKTKPAHLKDPVEETSSTSLTAVKDYANLINSLITQTYDKYKADPASLPKCNEDIANVQSLLKQVQGVPQEVYDILTKTTSTLNALKTIEMDNLIPFDYLFANSEKLTLTEALFLGTNLTELNPICLGGFLAVSLSLIENMTLDQINDIFRNDRFLTKTEAINLSPELAQTIWEYMFMIPGDNEVYNTIEKNAQAIYSYTVSNGTVLGIDQILTFKIATD